MKVKTTMLLEWMFGENEGSEWNKKKVPEDILLLSLMQDKLSESFPCTVNLFICNKNSVFDADTHAYKSAMTIGILAEMFFSYIYKRILSHTSLFLLQPQNYSTNIVAKPVSNNSTRYMKKN